jgi:GlpG protein
MRMIGHLPNENSAATFSDFLYIEGISNLVEAERDGWAVWIHSEDHLEKARELFRNYLGNPKDPKYENRSRQVAELKEREEQAEKAAEKRVHTRRRIFSSTLPFGMGPLTGLLTLLCIGVWGFMWLRPDKEFLNAWFYITHLNIEGSYVTWARGLAEIKHGEIWRLITPIFVHDWPSPFHLIFNVYALFMLGGMVEAREGSWLLALQVLIIAALSNLGQYYTSGPYFCGISGVVYGLFGYIWIRGRFDPGSGYFVHPQTVTMMLIWFVLCLAKIMPGVANTVHTIGLVTGVIWGFLSSVPALRGRSG